MSEPVIGVDGWGLFFALRRWAKKQNSKLKGVTLNDVAAGRQPVGDGVIWGGAVVEVDAGGES